MEETRHDTPEMRRFTVLAGSEQLPDATTIRNFRPVLESHGLAEQLFSRVNPILPPKEWACIRGRRCNPDRCTAFDEESYMAT